MPFNNAAERALRGIALGRRPWTFAGSQRGADRCAFMLTMIPTAKLNDVDAQAWLANASLASLTCLETGYLNFCHGTGPQRPYHDQAVAA